MTKFSDNIKKIARSNEIEAKIKIIPVKDKGTIGSKRGVGEPTKKPVDICPLLYSTRDNTYDFAALLAGTAGPTLGEPCSKLDTITGLTDVDPSQAEATFGSDVILTVRLDGIFR